MEFVGQSPFRGGCLKVSCGVLRVGFAFAGRFIMSLSIMVFFWFGRHLQSRQLILCSCSIHVTMPSHLDPWDGSV